MAPEAKEEPLVAILAKLEEMNAKMEESNRRKHTLLGELRDSAQRVAAAMSALVGSADQDDLGKLEISTATSSSTSSSTPTSRETSSDVPLVTRERPQVSPTRCSTPGLYQAADVPASPLPCSTSTLPMKASNVNSIITTEVPRVPPTMASATGTYQAAHTPTTLPQHDSLSVFNTEHLLVAHAKRSTLCLVDDTNNDQVVSVLLIMKSIPSAAIGLVETPILLSSSPIAVTIGHHFVVVERCYCTFDVATHALGPPPQPPWLEQREDSRLSFTFDPGITFRCEVQACMANGRGNYDQIQVLVGTEVQYSISVHCFLKEVIVEGSTLMDNDIWKGSSVAGIPLLKLWALQQQKSVFIPSFIRVVVFLWQSTPVIPIADCVYWCYWIVARCLQIDSDFADIRSESKKLLLKQEGEARLQVFEFQQYMHYMKLLDSVWSDVWLTSCTKNIQVTWDPGSWSYIQLVDKSKYLCKLLSVVAQQMLTCKNHCSVQERLSQVQLKGEKSNQSMKQCVTIELHHVYGNPCKLSVVSCTWTCYLLDSEDVPFNNGDWESLYFLWKTGRHAKRIVIFVASLAIVHFSAGMQNFKFIYLRRCTRGRGSVTDIQEGLAQCRQRKKIVAPTKSSMYLVSCRLEDF